MFDEEICNTSEQMLHNRRLVAMVALFDFNLSGALPVAHVLDLACGRELPVMVCFTRIHALALHADLNEVQ